MYFASVLLLVLVLPAGSIFFDHLHGVGPLIALVGKWFVFWSAGVRLSLAGIRQFFQPRFTSKEIFGMESDDVLPIVRELGVANIAAGVVGLISLARPDFIFPAAVSAMLFYGIAGMRHMTQSGRTGKRYIAMLSDLLVFFVFAAYVVFRL